MHDIVVDELERHLSGNASRAFRDHLDQCRPCRAEVAAMAEQAALLRDLKSDPEFAPQPSPGFYNRVADQIVRKQQREAWGLFSPGAAFFRRVAFASLLLLAGLGSFLVTRESSHVNATDPASIMAQHDGLEDHAPSADRDRMFITLATYRE